jgi:hypothetical protein
MRAPTMVRGRFRLRYRIRNKLDRLLIIDINDGNRYINELSIIDMSKCNLSILCQLLSFIHVEWYKELYDFFDKIEKYDRNFDGF